MMIVAATRYGAILSHTAKLPYCIWIFADVNTTIHLIPKWPLFRYSFVFIQIRPWCLVQGKIFFWIFSSRTRHQGLIWIKTKEYLNDGHFGIRSIIGHFGKYHNILCLSPQILHKHCFQFLLYLQWSQEKTKTMLMQHLRGQTKSIMVFSEVAYWIKFEWSMIDSLNYTSVDHN